MGTLMYQFWLAALTTRTGKTVNQLTAPHGMFGTRDTYEMGLSVDEAIEYYTGVDTGEPTELTFSLQSNLLDSP